MARLICPNCESLQECRVLKSGKPLRQQAVGALNANIQYRVRECELCDHIWETAEIDSLKLSVLMEVYDQLAKMAPLFDPERD